MRIIFLWCILLAQLAGCREKFTPRPRGHFRIEFPEKSYETIHTKYPYQFEVPQYSFLVPDNQNPNQPWWINIEFPENKAEVHISYYHLPAEQKSSRMQLAGLMEETRELAYKHSMKANSIKEQMYMNPDDKVFGTLYRIEGNAASPLQFFLTDSTQHFLRGALYIRATPDIDSLRPVIEFLERDVIHLIETTQWE